MCSTSFELSTTNLTTTLSIYVKYFTINVKIKLEYVKYYNTFFIIFFVQVVLFHKLYLTLFSEVKTWKCTQYFKDLSLPTRKLLITCLLINFHCGRWNRFKVDDFYGSIILKNISAWARGRSYSRYFSIFLSFFLIFLRSAKDGYLELLKIKIKF